MTRAKHPSRRACLRARSVLGFALLSLAACHADPSSTDVSPATATSTAPAAPAAAAAPATGALTCGDFLSVAEVTALGLEASKYDPSESQTEPHRGVLCNFGKGTMASIFRAEDYPEMIDGLTNGIKTKMLNADTGPSVGNDTHWVNRSGLMHEVMFRASSGKYASSVNSLDVVVAEKLARALDKKL